MHVDDADPPKEHTMTDDETRVNEPAGPTDEATGEPAEASARLVAASAPASTHPVKVKSGVAFDTAQLPAVAPGAAAEPWADGDFGDDDFEDDADYRPARAESHRRARRVTAVLALVAAVGVGFASGVLFQKHQGGSSTSGAGSSFASFFRGGAGARTGAGAGALFGGSGASAASGTVVGTVTAISGDTLYISSGSSSALTKVVTVPSSTITVPTAGTTADINPGDTVVVRGAQQSDGSFVAGTITDSGTASAAGAAALGAAASG
jgi:hypothetical protein